MCVCARVRAHMHLCTSRTLTHSFSHIRVSVCVSLVNESLYSNATPFSVCCVHLAVLGTVGGGLALSAHEWLLQRFAAVIAQHGTVVALARCALAAGSSSASHLHQSLQGAG